MRNIIVALILWFGSTGLIFQLLLLRGTVSHGVFGANTINQFLSSAAAWALAITIAVLGWRRPDRERPALFLALFFYVLPTLDPVLRFLHVRTQWFPFGVPVVLSSFTDIALLTCFSVVVLRHFRNSQRKQQAMEQDVKQAQEVQQVLIPEALPQVAGLTIESEYRPAREVGGDFFQIIPQPTRWQRADCGGRCDRQRIAGGNAGGLDCGCDSRRGRAQQRSADHAECAEPTAVRTRPGACHRIGAARRSRWSGHAGKCGTFAAVSEWERIADGRCVAIGHVAGRKIFADAFSTGRLETGCC